MSWLASFEVLPSPNHVLAKLAIFRGAEPSPHSPRATDSASVFHYYFKPFALFHPVMPHLVHQFHPPSLPYHLCTSTASPPPRSDSSPLWPTSPLTLSLFLSLSHPFSIPYPLSFTLALAPPDYHGPYISSSSLPRVSCLQAEMKISRLLAIETELLFHEVVDPLRTLPLSFLSLKLSLSPLPLELRTPKVLTAAPAYPSLFPLSFFPSSGQD